MFLVVLRRSGPMWDSSLPVEHQPQWEEHASFMEGLVEAGVVVLGGPLADEQRVVLIVDAGTDNAVRSALELDPWSGTILTIDSIDAWTIRLRGRAR